MPGIDGYEQFGAKAAAAATSENFEGTAGAGGVLFGKPVRRNRGGWGAAEAAQDLDVRPAGPLARLFRPPDVADLL